MSDPYRLNRVGLPTGEPGTSRPSHCPGALLRVSRSEMAALTAAGQRWDAGQTAPQDHGRGDVRALCDRDIEIRRGVRYGLCATCQEIERDNRAHLRTVGPGC